MNKNWSTAIFISLSVHLLIVSTAAQTQKSPINAEVVPIEVDLVNGPATLMHAIADEAGRRISERSSPVPAHQKTILRDNTKTEEPLQSSSHDQKKTDAIMSNSSSNKGTEADKPVIASVTAAPAVYRGGSVTNQPYSLSRVQPYVIEGPPPPYPDEAHNNGWTGRVRVKVLISEQGTVKDTAIVLSSGHADLDAAAMKGLRKWLFSPAYRNGQAVAAWVVVPVLFKLN